MKSNLLSELERVEKSRVTQKDFPVPSYLFVQKYGRSIQKELEEITRVLGKEVCFSFKTEVAGKEEPILQRFRMEEERHSGLGKRFAGCVFIELTGCEESEKISELLEYLEEHQNRICPLFTTKNYKSAEAICNGLERYFFVRTIDGMKYEAGEQVDLFLEYLTRYGLELSESAAEALGEFINHKEWQEEDLVEKRLQHLVSHIVYGRQLTEEYGNVIEKQELEEALQKETGNQSKKRSIGFVIGE